MQQTFGLTKDNVMTIAVDYGKPSEFHGVKMKFLKSSIVYMFQEPVKIQRSTYSLVVSDIGSKDMDTLNLLFKRMEPTITIKDIVFINYNDAKSTVFEKSQQYQIQVEIQGVKKSRKIHNLINKKVNSPIWKIRDIL